MKIIAGLFAGSFGRTLGPRKGALAAVVGILVVELGNFRAVLSVGGGFDELKALKYGKQTWPG